MKKFLFVIFILVLTAQLTANLFATGEGQGTVSFVPVTFFAPATSYTWSVTFTSGNAYYNSGYIYVSRPAGWNNFPSSITFSASSGSQGLTLTVKNDHLAIYAGYLEPNKKVYVYFNGISYASASLGRNYFRFYTDPDGGGNQKSISNQPYVIVSNTTWTPTNTPTITNTPTATKTSTSTPTPTNTATFTSNNVVLQDQYGNNLGVRAVDETKYLDVVMSRTDIYPIAINRNGYSTFGSIYPGVIETRFEDKQDQGRAVIMSDYNNDLDISEYFSHYLSTGSVILYAKIRIATTGETLVKVYEGPTIYSNGTPLTQTSKNLRLFPTYYISGYANPTTTTAGTLKLQQLLPTAGLYTITGNSDNLYFILNGGAKYTIVYEAAVDNTKIGLTVEYAY